MSEQVKQEEPIPESATMNSLWVANQNRGLNLTVAQAGRVALWHDEQTAALRKRLARIEKAANADAADLAEMRDGTKLTRAGLVMLIQWQKEELDERDSILAEANLSPGNTYLRCLVESYLIARQSEAALRDENEALRREWDETYRIGQSIADRANRAEQWCVEAREELTALRAKLDAAEKEREEENLRIAELERLNLDARSQLADAVAVIGDIEQCRCVEGDSITILCDNPEAENISEQSAVEACGGHTGYDLQRFRARNWREAIGRAADAARRYYVDQDERTGG